MKHRGGRITSDIFARIGISQPNPRSRKTAIYPSSMNLFISNLTDRLKKGGNIQNLQKYVKRGHVGVTFWDPLISPGRMKLETSYLAQRWKAVSTNEENAKLGQKESCGGHVTHFWNSGTPLISPVRLKLETSNLAQKWRSVSCYEKN